LRPKLEILPLQTSAKTLNLEALNFDPLGLRHPASILQGAGGRCNPKSAESLRQADRREAIAAPPALANAPTDAPKPDAPEVIRCETLANDAIEPGDWG
jgi:hypothetical protein